MSLKAVSEGSFVGSCNCSLRVEYEGMIARLVIGLGVNRAVLYKDMFP